MDRPLDLIDPALDEAPAGGAYSGAIMTRTVTGRRSIAKAITYRIVIMTLDFSTIYLFTGTMRVALGFMIASNVYTTLGYVLHERVWARITWGINDT